MIQYPTRLAINVHLPGNLLTFLCLLPLYLVNLKKFNINININRSLKFHVNFNPDEYLMMDLRKEIVFLTLALKLCCTSYHKAITKR